MSTLAPAMGADTAANFSDAPTTLERMRLTGKLHKRGMDLYLEQRMDLRPGQAAAWTTSRVYRLLETPATQDAVSTHLDRLVTVAGSSRYSAEGHRASLMLDSVEPFAGDPRGE